MALLCEMLGVRLEPIIRYSARISACENEQWQPALTLLCGTLGVMLAPIIHCSTRTRACEKGQW